MSGGGLTDAERELIAMEVLGRASTDGISTPLLAEGVLAAVARIKADAVAAERERITAAVEAVLTGSEVERVSVRRPDLAATLTESMVRVRHVRAALTEQAPR